jgi:3alpha(or 20beta)-hydroxysteroid dehydrogenase
METLEHRVALITGGARGQGAAEGRLFAAHGATVYLTDVLVEEGKQTAAATGATFIEHDVTDPDQWTSVVDRIRDERGHLDVLENNAGILHHATMTETTLDDWHRVIAVNQTGVFLGMRTVASGMKEQRSGSIINISSVAGFRGVADVFAYGATKWAIRGMTKAAARELGPFGVRVNSIHPGSVDTPMVAGTRLDEIAAHVPLGRVASADDVAKLALWLASDDSSYATGAEFLLDGGVTT